MNGVKTSHILSISRAMIISMYPVAGPEETENRSNIANHELQNNNTCYGTIYALTFEASFLQL